jgi:Ca2+-binding RTX toxin-like protein
MLFAALHAAATALPVARPTAASDPLTECFGEPATIVSVDAVVFGTGGRDVIWAVGPLQTVHAYGGDDLICGRTAGLVVYAGSGNDRVDAVGAWAVYGESGHDAVWSRFSTLVSGGSGNDTITGVDDDAAYGDAGDDVFVGDGMDVCDGGSGTDSTGVLACEATASIP